MNCKNCGYELPGDSSFCPNCGAKNAGDPPAQSEKNAGFFAAPKELTESVQPEIEPAPVPNSVNPTPAPSSKIRFSSSFSSAGSAVGEPPTTAPVDSKSPLTEPVPPARHTSYEPYAEREPVNPAEQASMQCPNCGAEIPADSQFCPLCGKSTTGRSRKTSPKKKTALIAGIAAAAVLLLAAVIGIVLINTEKGPLDRISSALSNTISARSFSADVSLYHNGSLYDGFSIQAGINPSKKELTAVIRPDDTDEVIAIYNDYLIFYEYDSYYGEPYVYKQDIRENLVDFFDDYNDITTTDFNNFDIAKLLTQLDESGYLYRSAKETFDLSAFNACMKRLMKQLNNETWLSENAGYHELKAGNSVTYSFDLNSYVFPQFLNTTLETFKPAFRSMDSYYDMKDDIAYIEQRGSAYADLKFVVKGNYLTSATIAFADSIYNSQSIVVNFSDIGTTSINTEQLAYWLRIAENY